MSALAHIWTVSFSPEGSEIQPFAVIGEFEGRAGYRMRGAYSSPIDPAWWIEYLESAGQSPHHSWVLANWDLWLADLCAADPGERQTRRAKGFARYENVIVASAGTFEADSLDEALNTAHDQLVVADRFEATVARIVYRKGDDVVRRGRVEFPDSTHIEADYIVERTVTTRLAEPARTRELVDAFAVTPTVRSRELFLVYLPRSLTELTRLVSEAPAIRQRGVHRVAFYPDIDAPVVPDPRSVRIIAAYESGASLRYHLTAGF